jgi:hypothetical protein
MMMPRRCLAHVDDDHFSERKPIGIVLPIAAGGHYKTAEFWQQIARQATKITAFTTTPRRVHEAGVPMPIPITGW